MLASTKNRIVVQLFPCRQAAVLISQVQFRPGQPSLQRLELRLLFANTALDKLRHEPR
jgi:hypothetical protein